MKLMCIVSALTLIASPLVRAEWVNPFIGTGGHGHTYPGASLPFGMVQLSPDTRLEGWDGCSGYHYADSTIYGFSHTHLSGTGVPDYGDILLMPTVGIIQLDKGYASDTRSGYASRFRHETERAVPGYYRVVLDDDGITAELTVTPRTGFHRYTYPESDSAHIIIDLTHRDPVLESSIRIVRNREIEGMRRSRDWARDQHVYFVASFSRPFSTCGIAVNDTIRDDVKDAAGKNVKAAVTFHTEAGERILVKVGISAVSIEGARKNLEEENPGWDFDSVHRQAERTWEQCLGKIHVEGGTPEQRTVFYTALYHAFLHPNIFMDVDRKYRGRDLQVHDALDFDNYTVFSLWDTFRAWHPLMTIIEPERTVDFIRTFLAQYEQGGMLPVWELAGNETGCMIGYHAVSVITDAYLKGLRGFDAEKALAAMRYSAEQDHLGLRGYRQQGYVPSEEEGESVSKTLEYAYDDWCIARMAGELGNSGVYETYMRRAQFYKNLFDPTTGFMRPRMNGGWINPFDPREVNFHFTEANAWQYSFFVPQDIEGLMAIMGGKQTFAERLDALFASPSATTGREQVDITGLIGQYAHGNEPSHHVAYLYDYAGQPWKTQQKVREIMEKLYSHVPDGLCGNEDCGQMSAWYLFSTLGFYPVTPGQDIYAIGTPLFEQATIRLENGKTFTVKAEGISEQNMYIQSAKLDGEPYTRSYVRHTDITGGGELAFVMGPAPNESWGSAEDDTPPSSITATPLLPTPCVKASSRAFADSLDITLSSPGRIFFTTNGAEPTTSSTVYTSPIRVRQSCTLKAVAILEGLPPSQVVSATFTKMVQGRTIRLNTPFASQYTGGGDKALIDGLRSSSNFRTGTWQGYQEVDVDAIIDLGAVTDIHRLSARFLQDQVSWIFMPLEVSYSISTDGQTFRILAHIENDIEPDHEGAVISYFPVENVNQTARYVQVRATNRKLCPEWHRGAGGKAWLFIDEIEIE